MTTILDQIHKSIKREQNQVITIKDNKGEYIEVETVGKTQYNPFSSHMVHDDPKSVIQLIKQGFDPTQPENFITPTYICKYTEVDFLKFLVIAGTHNITFSDMGYMEVTDLDRACNEDQMSAMRILGIDLSKAEVPGCMEHCDDYMN